MRFALLGAMEVRRADAEPVAIGAPNRRALLAALVLQRDRRQSADHLIDLLWGDDPPPAAVASLHAHASRLRRDLGDGVLRTTPAGYMIRVAASDVDMEVFEERVQAGRRHVAAGSWAEASTT